ncbi:MAG: peptidoglycan-binding protein [Patescibacteria group bacterium]|nr:peptidoglycan-binding protein [Patescibacteria group bacterium]
MNISYKKGCHRPLTIGIQKIVGTPPDGLFGKKTEEAIKQWQKNNNLQETGIVNKEELKIMLPQIELKYKILEVIACFEVGLPQYTSNAWGKVTEIDDGAGENYGVMQHNKFGSLQVMKAQYNFDDPRTFYGSAKGIEAQMWYFEEHILKKAKEFCTKFNMKTDRELLLVCDSIVQGGSAYPTRPPRSWEYWNLSQTTLKEIQLLYKKYPTKQAFEESLKLTERPGEIYAELKSRSGVPKWLTDQLSRRRTAYYGKGKVHGVEYDLFYFGFTGNEC